MLRWFKKTKIEKPVQNCEQQVSEKNLRKKKWKAKILGMIFRKVVSASVRHFDSQFSEALHRVSEFLEFLWRMILDNFMMF